MRSAIFLALLVFLPAYAFAEVPADGSAGGVPIVEKPVETQQPALELSDSTSAQPPTEVLPEASPEVKPESAPTTTTATPEPAKPAAMPTVVPSVPSVAPTQSPAEIEVPAVAPDSNTIFSPWFWLAGLIAVAGGSVYGAYSLMKASQAKGNQAPNTCDAFQNSLSQKEYELSLAEHELSFHEEALRILKEKALEQAEAMKNKVIGKVEATAKDVLLGKKGESDARAAFDSAIKAKDTYEDTQKKIEKTKELIDMLRGKRDGLSIEAGELQLSYAACVAKLPDAAKVIAAAGLKIVVPGNRPIRAIIFDWAGVMATEAYWIWVRKNITDITPLMSVDMKLDVGEMPHEEFVALLAKLSHKTPADVWSEVKSEMILNIELIALISELKKKYKIALLSNHTAPWLREVLDENNLWSLFDEYIISSEHKLVKPDSKIFKKMLTMLDVEAGEAVFTDDRQINVEGAQKIGIRSFLFTDVERFKKDIKSVGISV